MSEQGDQIETIDNNEAENFMDPEGVKVSNCHQKISFIKGL